MTFFILQLCRWIFFPPALKFHGFLEEKQVVVAAFPPSGAGCFPRTKQVVPKWAALTEPHTVNLQILQYC